MSKLGTHMTTPLCLLCFYDKVSCEHEKMSPLHVCLSYIVLKEQSHHIIYVHRTSDFDYIDLILWGCVAFLIDHYHKALLLVPLLFLPTWSQTLNYSAASYSPPTSLWSITTMQPWHWQPGMLSPAKPHSHLIKPLTIFLWTRHWDDWWDKPIGNQVSSYSCRDNRGRPADQSEQLKNHSALCVCLHQYPAPLGKKKKRRREE